MDIDAVIAEAVKAAEPAQASPEAKTDTAPPKQEGTQDNPANTNDPAESPDTQTKADHELTAEQLAKREANRQSHLNSKLAKMRRENRELREAVERSAKPPQQAAPNAPNGAPKKPVETDYSTWGEFLDAKDTYFEKLADWKLEQKLAERDTKTTETAKSQEVTAQKVQRIQEIATQEQEFAKANPEYTALYNEYSDFMSNIPKPVAEALMEADNATLALFALMKEGKLESLEDMSPYKISMEIGKAEIRGEGYLNRNKVTNAPAPMSPSKGTSVGGKSIDRMSYDELKDSFKLY